VSLPPSLILPTESSQKSKTEIFPRIHETLGLRNEAVEYLIHDSFVVHHIAFHPFQPILLYLVIRGT
jgi:hypothetical protein